MERVPLELRYGESVCHSGSTLIKVRELMWPCGDGCREILVLKVNQGFQAHLNIFYPNERVDSGYLNGVTNVVRHPLLSDRQLAF